VEWLNFLSPEMAFRILRAMTTILLFVPIFASPYTSWNFHLQYYAYHQLPFTALTSISSSHEKSNLHFMWYPNNFPHNSLQHAVLGFKYSTSPFYRKDTIVKICPYHVIPLHELYFSTDSHAISGDAFLQKYL
jgi:hypothetical protein